MIEPSIPLSREGIEEIVREMNQPPADTPERRATFERAEAVAPIVRRALDEQMSRRRK